MVGILALIAIVQIITESLPISSSGHCSLVVQLYQLFTCQQIALSQAYEYFLHGPTIIMLAVYFWPRWWPMVRHVWRLRALVFKACLLVLYADGISAPLHMLMEHYAIRDVSLWIGFLITAVLLASLYWRPRTNRVQLTWRDAVLIGLVQGIGVLGVSRLASTYVTGVWLGLAPRSSFYFSCMIQWPLIAAGFCKGLWQLRTDSVFVACCTQWWFIGLLALCAVVAYYVLAWVEHLLRAGKLWRFSYYLVAVAIFAAALQIFLMIHAVSCNL